MRFTEQKQLQEHYWKDTKIEKTKFLWLPVTLYGETRWLEKVTIIYQVQSFHGFIKDTYFEWRPVKFVNK